MGRRREILRKLCAVALPEFAPWQPAPCNIASALDESDPQRSYRAAALLLQRMLAAGVSRWHPNPLAALAEAEAKGVGGCPL